MKAFITRHPILSFYVLTFAISWGAGLILVGPVGLLSLTQASPMFMVVILAGIVGPAVAGLFLTGVIDGRAGLRDVLARLRRWRVGARWYAVALLTAPLLTAAIHLTLSLASQDYLPAIVTAADKATLLVMGISVALIVPVLEELGWTAFATPRLLRRHGILTTGVVMGLLWGAWHLPLFAGTAASSDDIPPALFLVTLLFAWPVPYRVLMVWVYDRTHSLLVAMLMHAVIDFNSFVLLPTAALSGAAALAYPIAYGAALWVVVAGVALVNRGRVGRSQVVRAAPEEVATA